MDPGSSNNDPSENSHGYIALPVALTLTERGETLSPAIAPPSPIPLSTGGTSRQIACMAGSCSGSTGSSFFLMGTRTALLLLKSPIREDLTPTRRHTKTSTLRTAPGGK